MTKFGKDLRSQAAIRSSNRRPVILPQLLGKKGEPRSWSFTHYDPRQNANGKQSRFARNLEFKLYDDGRFFDLKKDPQEVSPLPMDEKTTPRTDFAGGVGQIRSGTDFQAIHTKVELMKKIVVVLV